MTAGNNKSKDENVERLQNANLEPQEDFELQNATPVCPHCLRPVDPLAYYCPNCDSNDAINPLACYLPFVRIRFVVGMIGKLWRMILYDERLSVTLRILYLFIIICWLFSLKA